MTLNISGFGQTCSVPGYLYPSQLLNAPTDIASNFQTFAAGDALYIPAQSNDYLITAGEFLSVEFLDAVTGTWRVLPDMVNRPGVQYMRTNGVDRRLANRLGCPVGAIVANGGSGFVQMNATLVSNVGGSTWVPVIGGSLTVTSVTNAGANYSVAPLVLIPSPTPAGVNGSVGGQPATAFAVLSSGTVASVTMSHNGAGYQSAPTVLLVPSPFDPNFGTISAATVTLGINANTTGAVTAALCTNFGAPLATLSALTLTAAGGAGAGATITPQVLQTIASASVVAGGAGWGTASAFASVQAVGGAALSVAATNLSNPTLDFSGFRPSNLLMQATTNAGGTITSVTFPNGTGLFLQTPTAAIASGGTLPTTLASIVFTMGTSRGTALLQPL